MGLISALQAKTKSPTFASFAINITQGNIIHQHHAHRLIHPASLTKIMTLYLTFEALDQKKISLQQNLITSKKASQSQPSWIALKKGDPITVEKAILALIIRSANDAAIVLAENLAKNEITFAQMMTYKARQLGLTKTIFRNASGLHNQSQVTTAQNIALLASRLIKDFPHYYTYFQKNHFTYAQRTYYNSLRKHYQYVDGLKTGFIDTSGFNLVALAQKNNQRIIAVIIGAKNKKERDEKMKKLLKKSFQSLEK